MTQDFIVTDQTGVWLFEPLSEAAQNFVRDKVGLEEWLWCGRAFVVEHRGGGALAEDLEDEGFTVITRH